MSGKMQAFSIQQPSTSVRQPHLPARQHGSGHPPRKHMWRFVRWLLGRPAACNQLAVPYLATDEHYVPPEWAAHLALVPTRRVGLGMLPTPIHPWKLPGLPEGVEVWIKRDDMTGSDLSGNKVRKLEFLLAAAKAAGHDCVITIGGIQSNHCRATAVASRLLGLECHLLLRTSRALIDSDPGLVGNLLLDRMSGAAIHLVTKEEYARVGSPALGALLLEQLRAAGKNPYLIPVGGSNALGTWGYLQAVEEIRQQTSAAGVRVTDIVMACGSGGTTAGLALGTHLSGLGARVHAYGVCDDPDYFYNFVDGLLEDLGASSSVGSSSSGRGSSGSSSPGGSPGAAASPGGGGLGARGGAVGGGVAARALLRAVQARGAGYAISTDEELRTVKEVAEATGVLLDPVYSGKAVHGLLAEIRSNPDAWRGRTVLFVHTGGVLGMYDKLEQLGKLYTSGEAGSTSGNEPGSTASSTAGAASPYPANSRVARLAVPQRSE